MLIKNKIYGLLIIACGVASVFVTEGDATVAVLAIPTGIILLLAKENLVEG